MALPEESGSCFLSQSQSVPKDGGLHAYCKPADDRGTELMEFFEASVSLLRKLDLSSTKVI